MFSLLCLVYFASLLSSTLQNSKHMAGYTQQDAHEFFIALIDGLHNYLGGVKGMVLVIIRVSVIARLERELELGYKNLMSILYCKCVCMVL